MIKKITNLIKRNYFGPLYRSQYERNKEIIVLSFPKSGRTWLRSFLNHYYFQLYPLAFLDGKYSHYNKKIPDFNFTHYGYTDKMIQKSPQSFSLKNGRNTKLLFLIRDPRDVFVSYYFQLTKRKDPAVLRIKNNIDWGNIEMKELLYHSEFGIKPIINFMNNWYVKLKDENIDFRLVSYEEMHLQTEKTFEDILTYIGEQEVNPNAISHALNESSFSKMKEKEKSNLYNQQELSPTNKNDNDSYKARKGKAKGYVEYIFEDDLIYCEKLISEVLHPDLKTLIKG